MLIRIVAESNFVFATGQGKMEKQQRTTVVDAVHPRVLKMQKSKDSSSVSKSRSCENTSYSETGSCGSSLSQRSTSGSTNLISKPEISHANNLCTKLKSCFKKSSTMP